MILSEGLTSKPKSTSSPDWFVLLGCQGVGCQTLLLVGGFFEWERQSVDSSATPRYCAKLSSEVYIWTKADPSLQKSMNSKLHLLKLHGQCTHEYDPVEDVGLPYSNLRGPKRKQIQVGINPSRGGTTKRKQDIADMPVKELATRNLSKYGGTSCGPPSCNGKKTLGAAGRKGRIGRASFSP